MALLTIAEDDRTLAERAAARFVELVNEAVRSRGEAAVSLTGGTTPKRMYELLATEPWREQVPWDRVQLHWGDERHVAPDHKDSNFGMAWQALVMHVPIPASNVHRILGERPAEEAARLYEQELPERFDVMLLGLGEDAHIASIFPGSPVLHSNGRRVAAVWIDKLNTYRITLMPRVILDSTHIMLVVSGASKAPAVAAAFEAPDDPDRYPVHLLRGAGDRVEWFIDAAAARDLRARPA